MKTERFFFFFFPMAISFLWLSGTCQGCGDGVAGTPGEMATSCLPWRCEQGKFGKHTGVIQSDQSLPMANIDASQPSSTYQTMLQRLGPHIHSYTVPKSYSHPMLTAKSQHPGCVLGTYIDCWELNCHFGSNKQAQFIHQGESFCLNVMGRTWQVSKGKAEERTWSMAVRRIFSKVFQDLTPSNGMQAQSEAQLPLTIWAIVLACKRLGACVMFLQGLLTGVKSYIPTSLTFSETVTKFTSKFRLNLVPTWLSFREVCIWIACFQYSIIFYCESLLSSGATTIQASSTSFQVLQLLSAGTLRDYTQNELQVYNSFPWRG